ncbi:MAG: DnaJ domain-containing protein [Lachnospiraceae bacterium]|nr:DnaJ domain-containing protein [Lachnospiraceae bacterium]
MVHAVIAVIAMIFLLIFYGALMLFTDYIKAAPYFKVMLLNCAWFMIATGYKEYDLYYPTVFENKWFNLLLMTSAFMLLIFEISKFVKLRNALVISTGAITHLIVASLILNFCGGLPGWAVAVYLTVSSLIVLGIHLSAIYGGKNTAPGNFFSRVLAGIVMMPAPFVITSTCLLALSSDSKKVIETMPLGEFIERVYDFVRKPDFNYSGKLMLFNGAKYERNMLLSSLIVALIAFVIYLLIDSTVDYRSDLKEKTKHRKEAEKERVRAEISSRIHAQLEKIDSCMAYISSNYKTLKVREDDMKQLRVYYDEATRIKYSYNGAASGPILKRVTELKTEIFVIRDRILNDHYGEKGDTAEQDRMKAEYRYEQETEKEKQNDNSSKPGQITGYFNGCKTEEEIKKRYRDLCKVFHPDSENGDQETFLKVKQDYEALMGKDEPA